MELQAFCPGSRLLSRAIIVLALATQALPAPYTVIANVQRHVVSSDGNTIHFPAQVTIQCPDFFGLRCRHQVNGNQVLINIFHENPDGEGDGVVTQVKSVIITEEGRVETSPPTYNVKHGQKGSTSNEDSAMNDVFSGESFNGKGSQEESYRKYGGSAEMTTVKSKGGFWPWGSFLSDVTEETRTESSGNQETETENPSNDEENTTTNTQDQHEEPEEDFKEESKEDVKEKTKEDFKEESKIGFKEESKEESKDYQDWLREEPKEESKEKHGGKETDENDYNQVFDEETQDELGNNDDDSVTKPNYASNDDKSDKNEFSLDDSQENRPNADPFTYDEVTTNAPNKEILQGSWWSFGR